MSDPSHTDTGWVSTVTAVASLIVTGLLLIFRAAFKVGSDTRASERIVQDLAEIKVELRNLAQRKAKEHHEIFVKLENHEGRLRALEHEKSGPWSVSE